MKKRVVWTLLFIIFCSTGSARTLIDSLELEVEIAIKTEEKLNAMYNLTHELSMRNPSLAHQKVLAYLDLAKTNKNQFETARAHYLLGIILHLKTEFGEAMKELHKALIMFEEQKNKKYIAETNVALSSLYQISGNYDASITRLQYGMDYFSKTNNLNRKADLAFNMGNLQSYMGQYDSSLYYFQIAENLFDKVDDELGKGRLYLCTGSVLNMKKDHDLSFIYSNKAAALTKKQVICSD